MDHFAARQRLTKSPPSRLPRLRRLCWPAATLLVVACSATEGSSPRATGSGGGSAAGGGGAGGARGVGGDPGFGGNGPVERNDFESPILDTGAPADAPALFAQADQGANGPCLHEPELGSLFPRNWLRPRFRFIPGAGQNLFEITLEIPHQKSPLVVYTTSASWSMAKPTWELLTAYGTGGPIHVTVRGATYDNGTLTSGPTLGSKGDIEIAPVGAPGSVVYWTTSNGTVLKGFKIGDETVQDVLKPAQTSTSCVACHASTPDGMFVGFVARDYLNAGDAPDRLDIRSLEDPQAAPSFVTPDASALLARPGQELPVYSKAHWVAGDRVQVSEYALNGRWELIWTDLEATSQARDVGWGVFARNGDLKEPASPSFSHDGTRLAYVSGSTPGSGSVIPDGDLYTIDYSDRQGGAATPVPGASQPSYNEFYPTFSPDDHLLAFSRAPFGSSSYNNPAAEVFVIPSAGGAPTRLRGNDPPACLQRPSPGVTNSWPRWAPEKATEGGKDYYFLVFSSTRNPASAGPQLYVSPVVVSGATITTYAALYLWNQPEAENNHTPAWDSFELPEVPR